MPNNSDTTTLRRRLIKYRLALIAAFLFVLGVGIHLAQLAVPWFPHETLGHPDPLGALFKALADALIIAGTVGLVWEYLVRQEARDELRNELAEIALARPDALARLNTETLEACTKAVLTAHCKTDRLGEGIYEGLVTPVLRRAHARPHFAIRDSHYAEHTIREPSGLPGDLNQTCYEYSTVLEYTTALRHDTFTVAWTHEPAYAETIRNDQGLFMWWIAEPIQNAPSDKLFVMEGIWIFDTATENWIPLSGVKSAHSGYPTESFTHAWLQDHKGITARIKIRYSALMRRDEHYLASRAIDPTRHYHVVFDWSQCPGLRGKITPVRYFVGQQQPAPSWKPNPTDSSSATGLDISVLGWVFPGSGVTIVWP